MAKSLHWMDAVNDPNVHQTKMFSTHINRPRISGETIFKMLSLKSKMLGERLDMNKEVEAFEEVNKFESQMI